jgi:hypothetical protein
MKKAAAYIILILFTVIYFISSNDFLMKKIAQYRYQSQSLWSADKYKYGDLYGLSFLPEYRIPVEKKFITRPEQPSEKKIDLYCICDSYVWGFTPLDSVLYGVDKYRYTRWNYDDNLMESLDTAKINFLLIEIAERNIRDFLADTLSIYSKLQIPEKQGDRKILAGESFTEKLERYLFNPKIDQNLEFNLFDYPFLTPVKEFKAKINHDIFGRINPDVAISSNKEYLFYSITTNPTEVTSSFNNINENELRIIIDNINAAYNHYKALGFDYIFLSIVPNPVSMLDTQRSKYNMLIDKIQNNKNLLMPHLDTYAVFKDRPQRFYYRSDSHWNYDGFGEWVNIINGELKKIYSKQK